MSKSKSKNPSFPKAHPTAPGGMSQQALADELVERHGWSAADLGKWLTTKGTWKQGSWPAMIDAVGEARLAEERESKAAKPKPAKPASLLVLSPDTNDYIFDGHAGAGPSGSERWMSCTASLEASREFLETLTLNQQVTFAGANEAARQGTTAHAAAEAEAKVILGTSTDTELQATLMELAIVPETEGEAYDDEMAEYIEEYLDLIRTYVSEGRKVSVERRVTAVVPLSGDHDGEDYEIKGSADFVGEPAVGDTDVVVADLKYGNGIWVDVDENSQARIYGYGVLCELTDDEGNLPENIETITYHIVQPRLGGIRTWSESVDDLLDWVESELSEALTAALYGPEAGATYEPSEGACQFCPARGGCAALAERRMKDGADLFSEITAAEFDNGPGSFPETGTLDNDRLGDLLAQALGITKLAAALKEEAQRRAFRGETVPGFKLVNYQPPRKWTEDAAAQLDGDDYRGLWVSKLITPTQAVKSHAELADMLGGLIDKPSVRPVIAPVGDRRSDWVGKPPEQMFSKED